MKINGFELYTELKKKRGQDSFPGYESTTKRRQVPSPKPAGVGVGYLNQDESACTRLYRLCP